MDIDLGLTFGRITGNKGGAGAGVRAQHQQARNAFYFFLLSLSFLPHPKSAGQYEERISKVLQMQKPKQNYISLNQLTAHSLHNDYIQHMQCKNYLMY